MNKLVLTRNQNEVFYEDKKLTIVPQSTKGPGKEVVKIEGLPGSNGKKWISLSLLKDGLNELTCQPREVVSSPTKKYNLTQEESLKVSKLQGEIDKIIEVAKSRYIPKPDLTVDTSKMTPEEKETFRLNLMKYYGL